MMPESYTSRTKSASSPVVGMGGSSNKSMLQDWSAYERDKEEDDDFQ